MHDDDGPILLTAHWQIDPDRREQFVEAMQPVRKALKSKGALSWQLAGDLQQPGDMLETFSLATWSEYQRLPERVTVTDKALEQALEHAAGSELPNINVYRVIDVQAADENATTGQTTQ